MINDMRCGGLFICLSVHLIVCLFVALFFFWSVWPSHIQIFVSPSLLTFYFYILPLSFIYTQHVQRHTDGEPNFPEIAQEQCLIIIRHLQSLTYEDIPDYDLIDKCLEKTVYDVSVRNRST